MCDRWSRPYFFDWRSPCARKEHKCKECGEIITKGETYVYYVQGCQDCGFWAVTICCQCDADWSALLKVENDEERGICYGDLNQRIGEALDNGDIDQTYPLVARWFPERFKAEGKRENEDDVEDEEGEFPIGAASPFQKPLF